MTGLLQHMAFVSMPGGGEWIIILVIGLLVFGRRLPDVARSLGKSVNEFKKGMREFQDSADEVVRDVSKATSDVTSDFNHASGMDNYGYEEPGTTTSDGYHYDSTESGGASESADPGPEVTEDSAPQVSEAPATQDEHDPQVEPMK